jgi:ethanolamine utilization protein EutQ
MQFGRLTGANAVELDTRMMKNTFQIFRRRDADLHFKNGHRDGHAVHRVMHEGNSDQLAAGYARLNGTEATMTSPYDEVAVCIEGIYRATVDGAEHVLEPGDLMFLPRGTTLTYSGQEAVLVYCIWPANWRQVDDVKQTEHIDS